MKIEFTESEIDRIKYALFDMCQYWYKEATTIDPRYKKDLEKVGDEYMAIYKKIFKEENNVQEADDGLSK